MIPVAPATEALGYFHGRFQPFHRGHLQVVRHALERHELLVLGVSNPFRTPPVVDERFSSEAVCSLAAARSLRNNPWPFWARVLMIREGLKTEGIDPGRVLFMPNVASTGLPIDEVMFPKSMTVVYVCPKGEHNKATARMYREDGWSVVELSCPPDAIGSGMIRNLMREGGDWEPLVPEGTARVIRCLQPIIHEPEVDEAQKSTEPAYLRDVDSNAELPPGSV